MFLNPLDGARVIPILRTKCQAAAAALAFLGVGCAAAVPSAPAGPTAAACGAGERVWGPVVVSLAGGESRELPLPSEVIGPVVIEIRERGIDVTARLAADPGTPGPASMSPTERSGTIHLLAGRAHSLTLAGRDDPTRHGHLEISAWRPAPADGIAACAVGFLAAADANFAAGEAIARGALTGRHPSARHYYRLASEGYFAAHARLTDEDPARADAALAAADVEYTGTYDFAAAARWAVEARRLATRLRDPYRSARAEALLAQSLIDDPAMPAPAPDFPVGPAARFRYARALLARLAAFHFRRGETLDGWGRINTLGLSYYDEGAFREAVPYLRRAAAGFDAAGAQSLEGMALQNVALCEWGLGELTHAERTFAEATRHIHPQPFPYYYLNVITNYAMLSHVVGALDRALRLQHEALALAEQFEAPILIASNLYSLGNTYYALGDLEQSAYYLERARAVHSPSARSYVSTLRSLAAVYRELGRRREATAAGVAALGAATSAVARLKIGIGLAEDQAAAGHERDALAALDDLLANPASANPSIRVEVLLARARIRAKTADAAGAEADLRQGLALLRSLESPTLAFQCQLELARLLWAGGRSAEALRTVDAAIALAAELRGQTANPELRAQKQEPLRAAYDVKVDLLMDRYREAQRAGARATAMRAAEQALAVADSARAPTFLELVADSAAEARATPGDRRSALYREIAARQYQLDARRDAHEADDDRARFYQSEIARLRREADLLGGSMSADAAGAEPVASANPRAWVSALARHYPHTAVIAFWMGPSQSLAWRVTARGVQVFELGPTATLAQAVEVLAGRLHGFVTSSVAQRRAALDAVSARLAAPFAAEAGDEKNLIIVPDRGLGYVPFAAISVDSAMLVRDHDLALTPAVRVFMRTPSPGPRATLPSRLLVVADPVYEARDPRRVGLAAGAAAGSLVQEMPGYRRLPYARQEADGISALVPAKAVVRLDGLDATRRRVLGEPLGDFRYLHFAAHGIADARMPALSAIILGAYDRDGPTAEQPLRAADLLALRLRADVVTLSACDSGRGREVAGEGIVGFGYVALARGAHAVVSSLWPVADEISVALMTDLYRGLVRGERAPAALSEAMRAVLHRTPDLDVALWAAYQTVVADAASTSTPQ